MAITKGRLERQITVPTSGYTAMLWEDSSSVGAVTIASASYYWSTGATTFPAAIKAALESTGAGTYTVTLSDGESGTGKLTIAVSGGASTFKLASASTAWSDLMGFSSSASLLNSEAASHTGDLQVEALWMPDGHWDNKFGSGDYGWLENNTRSSESPSGDVSVIGGGRNKRVMALRYSGLSRANTRTSAETTTNASFETFFVNDLRGDKAYCAQPGGPLRWHPDRDDDATFTTVKYPDVGKHNPEAMVESWTGLWMVTLERLVVQA